MDEIHTPRRLTYMEPQGLRKVKISRARWKDDMQKEVRMLGMRRWWATAMNQEEQREFLEEAKTL
jgi:hypothetical protein